MSVQYSPDNNKLPLGVHPSRRMGSPGGAKGQANQDKAYKHCLELGIISNGRWDCHCSPDKDRPDGLGG